MSQAIPIERNQRLTREAEPNARTSAPERIIAGPAAHPLWQRIIGLLARGALTTNAIAEQLDVPEAPIRNVARVRQSNSQHQKLLTTQAAPVEWVLEPEQDGLERGLIGEVGGRQDRPLDTEEISI